MTINESLGSFEVSGRFYVIEGRTARYQCRDLLEIQRRGVANTGDYDAVFIMMNPGSSEPAVEIEPLPLSQARMVATKPDRTQYQLMRLMRALGWSRLMVLNLSDLREKTSSLFYGRFQDFERLEGDDTHSIFSSSRKEHLYARLNQTAGTPIFLAWGVDRKLKVLAQRALCSLGEHRYFGLSHINGEWAYRHPLPRKGEAQARWRDDAHAALRAFG